MIITFPMLVSQAVSPIAVPAISKTLEIYLVGNNMDYIMSQPLVINQLKRNYKKDIDNFDFKIKKGKFVLEHRSEVLDEGIRDQTDPGTKEKEEQKRLDREWEDLTKREKDLETKTQRLEDAIKKAELELMRAKSDESKTEISKRKQELEDEKFKHQKIRDDVKDKQEEIKKKEEQLQKALEKREEKRKSKTLSSAKIEMTDEKSISLQPTYAKIEVVLESGEKKYMMIGIKVLPYRVISEERLSTLIVNDIRLTGIASIITKLGRGLMRYLYGQYNKVKKFFRVDIIPTGDPRQDIILGRAGFEGTGFVLLSKNEDIDQYLLNNISKMHRMFKLYWGNIIIADDINRNAHFCLKRFKGVCNIVNYAMMYQNLGQLKVYETLDDAQRQQSSLFKLKKKFSKVVSEWYADLKQLNYTILNEDKKND